MRGCLIMRKIVKFILLITAAVSLLNFSSPNLIDNIGLAQNTANTIVITIDTYGNVMLAISILGAIIGLGTAGLIMGTVKKILQKYGRRAAIAW
jgi:circularin A/uberolysin family circular bacteriocin